MRDDGHSVGRYRIYLVCDLQEGKILRVLLLNKCHIIIWRNLLINGLLSGNSRACVKWAFIEDERQHLRERSDIHQIIRSVGVCLHDLPR